MVRRWASALVLLGLLAGCESTPAGDGTPEAAPVPAGSTSPGLPVPDEPTEPATTSAAPPPTTTAPTTTPATTTAPTTTPPVATPPRTAPAGRRCPADVAATLPDSRPATLIAGFRTSRFRLYYCRTAGGQLYYRGISRADAAKATTLPARRIAGGFEARGVEAGSVYVFRVAQGRLFVIQDGKQIFVEPIIATL
ncbi:MAG: hypothetical protein AVDCRST_MAG41-806 [uncultured Corynebacteriales bacterium]|uniref:Uncharacterized protein n=1 Tax=uncultured Mycobacteriales bacterium TaxID=581187 RepID=A0A6J4HMU4_9ACTN|nr:MAG: hypothetical protein AVDCRST_MAG41-806 [uncultured Corynebacteriales bacterium]